MRVLQLMKTLSIFARKTTRAATSKNLQQERKISEEGKLRSSSSLSRCVLWGNFRGDLCCLWVVRIWGIAVKEEMFNINHIELNDALRGPIKHTTHRPHRDGIFVTENVLSPTVLRWWSGVILVERSRKKTVDLCQSYSMIVFFSVVFETILLTLL